MKRLSTILLFLGYLSILGSCNSHQPSNIDSNEEENSLTNFSRNLRPQFQGILDSHKLKGAVLILDLAQASFYSNDFERCEMGYLPASTYKIPNSLIGLETGVVQDENTLFKWDGQKRRLAIWEKDMSFKEAFHLSCVPCYQEIARKVGVERMQDYIQKFNYGKMDIRPENIDKFWLEGNSRISAFEQLDFLKRFYEEKLPISERTYNIMKSIMILESYKEYELSGKTGWSIRDGFNVGWFVGHLKIEDKTYYVVTNVEPLEGFDMDQFAKIRTKVSIEAFKALGIIQ